ncbi:hypothetical protein D3C79_1092770 [compost metagenome]
MCRVFKISQRPVAAAFVRSIQALFKGSAIIGRCMQINVEQGQAQVTGRVLHAFLA